MNEIKTKFYCLNIVISLTYVFYLILVLVYKFLYLHDILSCFRLYLILHVYDQLRSVNYDIKRICYVMLQTNLRADPLAEMHPYFSFRQTQAQLISLTLQICFSRIVFNVCNDIVRTRCSRRRQTSPPVPPPRPNKVV